jgi:hypothetical protein
MGYLGSGVGYKMLRGIVNIGNTICDLFGNRVSEFLTTLNSTDQGELL